MVEDATTSNRLAWDDSVWEYKCIVLTDAADEWYHPKYPFPHHATLRASAVKTEVCHCIYSEQTLPTL
ncbi:hypothetical protein DPMN_050609 [Dreissena polymorpha]|uniref:Uncharacterized protein n=1 Tax=Dreissena polymorpha TaxID=45954 RepID=A0A9D4CHJ6_DREPO|nr:hypothetical protein DPMN_050609 [Dreissena polymorpha]